METSGREIGVYLKGDVCMDEKISQYILQRFRGLSSFSNCVPFEYPAYMIKKDLDKAGIEYVPSEEEIGSVIEEAKSKTRDMVSSMLRQNYPLSSIRDWCEYSPDSSVPVPPPGSVNMSNILSRYDYFNYELNRMVREEQITSMLEERKTAGDMFDVPKFSRDLEKMGLRSVSDELSRVEALSTMELTSILKESEEESSQAIMSMVLSDLGRDEIISRVKSDSGIIFSDNEVEAVLDGLVRRERFSIIIREVVRMGTSEMWNLINTIESFKMWRLSSKSGGKNEEASTDQMLEMLKDLEHRGDSLREGYLFQVSKLDNSDLSQLERLIQAFISWKGQFYYLQSLPPEDHVKLSERILDGFSHEHGVEPSIFEKFILRR